MNHLNSPLAYDAQKPLSAMNGEYRDLKFVAFMVVLLGPAVLIYLATKLNPRLRNETRMIGHVIRGIMSAIVVFLTINLLSIVLTWRFKPISEAFDTLVYTTFQARNDAYTSPGHNIWVQLCYAMWKGFEMVCKKSMSPRIWENIASARPFETACWMIALVAIYLLMNSLIKVIIEFPFMMRPARRIARRGAGRRRLPELFLNDEEEEWLIRTMNRASSGKPSRPALDWQATHGNPVHQDPANKAPEADCPICYEGIKCRTQTYTCPHTQCDNSFHRRCIKKLHQSPVGSHKCPLCRRPTRLATP